MKKGTTAALVLGLGGLLLAACGGGGSSVSSPGTTAKTPSTTAKATSGTVNVADSKLGKILVDANGRTLYAFDHDTPTTSACTTANGCAGLWPPLMASSPAAGSGVTASMLSVLAGGSQVVYNGHPLYTFAQDTAPGDVKGQNFAGNIWHVVSPAGQTITAALPASTPATSSGGSGSSGGGYGY